MHAKHSRRNSLVIGSNNWRANSFVETKKFMTHDLMTQETPAKVMGLLGVALVSMSFMFAVTVSQASFSQVYNPVPDVLAPANIMAALDNVSHDYAMFVQTQLVAPGQQSYELAASNLAYIGQNATFEVAQATGLNNLLPQDSSVMLVPRVAGAYVRAITSQ